MGSVSEPRIVVGVDGSAGSRRALRWAAEEARQKDATLRIVLAWEPADLAAYSSVSARAEETGHDERQRYLSELRSVAVLSGCPVLIGLYCGWQGRKEPFCPDFLARSKSCSLPSRSCLTLARAKTEPLRWTSSRTRSTAPSAVKSTSTFASTLRTNHRIGSGC